MYGGLHVVNLFKHELMRLQFAHVLFFSCVEASCGTCQRIVLLLAFIA